MKNLYGVILGPLVTEKTSAMKAEANKIAFRVVRDANKVAIKNAVESMFDVKVTDVNTQINRGKPKRVGRSYGRRQNWKKAVVTLSGDADLDVFHSFDIPDAPEALPEDGE